MRLLRSITFDCMPGNSAPFFESMLAPVSSMLTASFGTLKKGAVFIETEHMKLRTAHPFFSTATQPAGRWIRYRMDCCSNAICPAGSIGQAAPRAKGVSNDHV